MAQSGAMLREVGTTNKTRAVGLCGGDQRKNRADPARPSVKFPDRRVHRTAAARRSSSRSAGKFNIPVAEDLGSGDLGAFRRTRVDPGRRCAEPALRSRRCRRSIEAGVDVCCFSGDKLLGGPQAGIIVGRAALIERDPHASADARAARRQDDLRRARSDARRVCRRPRGGDGAGAADADDDRRRGRARARTRWPPRIGARPGWRAEVIAGVSADRRRQRAGCRAADVAGRRSRRTACPPTRSRPRLRRQTPPVIARIEQRSPAARSAHRAARAGHAARRPARAHVSV